MPTYHFPTPQFGAIKFQVAYSYYNDEVLLIKGPPYHASGIQLLLTGEDRQLAKGLPVKPGPEGDVLVIRHTKTKYNEEQRAFTEDRRGSRIYLQSKSLEPFIRALLVKFAQVEIDSRVKPDTLKETLERIVRFVSPELSIPSEANVPGTGNEENPTIN